MRSNLLFLSFAFLLSCFFACKRNVYDPKSYDGLLYKAPEKLIPPKEYIFRANIKGSKIKDSVGVVWNTTGAALVDDKLMTITGTLGDEAIEIALKFNNINELSEGTTFSIGSKKDTASLVIKIGNRNTKYVSKGRSSGKVTILRFDNIYSQIEGNFDMVLYNTTIDSAIAKGYFKINFSPNSLNWEDTGEKMKAQIITATKGNHYEIIGTDTLTKRSIKIIVPLVIGGGGYGSRVDLGTNGSAIFYTDSTSTSTVGGVLVKDFVNVAAFTSGAIKPGITIFSISDNVIKGRFNDIRVGGEHPDDDFKYVLNGTFSAKF